MALKDSAQSNIIRKMGPLLGLVLLSGAMALLSDRFLDVNNLLNVARQVSINAIISVGMTMVILTGGIDLSVGSTVALAGSVTAGLLTAGQGMSTAILAGLVIGVVLGCFNGFLITRANVPPFIATLGTMTAARGFTLVYTDGRPITGMDDAFRFLGGGYIAGIPVPVVLMIIVFAAAYVVLRQTKFGRYVYAIGGNEEAARLSGIHTKKILLSVYSIAGLLAGFSGIIMASRLNSAQPTAGVSFELDAIAAVVLGGTSLSGGMGTIGGTLIGALIIGILDNGLNLLNVSSFYQQVAKGAVILLAVIVDNRRKKGA
ncbi:ABC transporter permease [Azotosporobacter soli]|uniref:ABC transporter permease n=1 Tax=Azotosporobacter soli TaxID=3055040 RepID=UPI0031FF0E7F